MTFNVDISKYLTSSESVNARIFLSVKSSLSLILVLDVKPVCLPVSDVTVEQSPPHPPVQDEGHGH